ncbi:sodium:proton antiporter [Kibdelosporangium aridum]|uniref:Sodium:proton antiporter n=1 Tax=Kibdelosporangium aridum TaxID=2030 RepID=A0A428ZU62_KIBAR|nr:MnhB domain-containing protein [Kibdelosporangium aridum]RSM91624.1 sodium:proton antiporter [Kibdelosporangium aridum]
MSRRVRIALFLTAASGLAVVLAMAFLAAPPFGESWHPYRDSAVAIALRQATSNVVSSINFDLRAMDTLGEETILFASVIGAATLLRLGDDEVRRPESRARPVIPTVRVLGWLLLPVALLLGVDVIAHGQLTPGGGFQGGVVVATGVHLLYVAGSYRALRKLRPLDWYTYAESVGVGAFVGLGCLGILTGSAFLANVLPKGEFGDLFSGGTVGILSVAVGLEVAAAVVVLLAQFLEQAIAVVRK